MRMLMTFTMTRMASPVFEGCTPGRRAPGELGPLERTS
jgi:hypothetical protein